MAKFGNEVIHIPIKDLEFNTMRLIATSTGKEIVKIEDIKEVNITAESQTDYDLNPRRITEQTYSTKAEMTKDNFLMLLFSVVRGRS